MNPRKISVVCSVMFALHGCAADAPSALDEPLESAAEEGVQPQAQIAQAIGLWAVANWFTNGGGQIIGDVIDSTWQSWIDRWSRSANGTSALTSRGFASIGGEASSSPAISSWGPGRLDVFVRGTDGGLWHRAYQEGGSNWENLRGTIQGDPAAVSWGPGRIDVFVRGADDALWQKSFEDGRWGDWESLGGSLRSGPAVAASGEGHLHVFARGSNNQLVYRELRDGEWEDWQRLGGSLTSDPAVAYENGRLHVAARGPDNAIWYRRHETGWTDWQSIGGFLVGSAPAIVANDDGRLDVFARGPDNALWTNNFTNRWSGWRSLGGTIASGPDAVWSAPNRVDVVVTGGDKAVYHRFYTYATDGRPNANTL